MHRNPSVEAQRRRAESLVATGRLREALASLTIAAGDLREVDRIGAATLLVEAVQIGLLVDGPDRARALAEEAVRETEGTQSPVAAKALIRLGDAMTWAGRHQEAAAAWQRATKFPPSSDPSLACERANAALRGGDLPLARDLAYDAVVRARDAESRVDLVDSLTIAAMAEIHLGHLREALDASEQVLQVTDPSDGVIHLAGVGLAAWVTALLGDVARCRQLLDQAAVLSQDIRLTAPGGFAEGWLAIGEARYADAVRAFESKSTEMPMSPAAQALGVRPYVPALVEAYARAGRTDDARELLAEFFDAALATGQPRHAAPALRARGVVESDAGSFDQALEAHARWDNRFEEARTLLARGEVLRRIGRREDARADLRAAVERFEQVGATTWRDRGRTELRAAGDRSAAIPTPRGRGPEKLTQQEAAIAALVTEGLSNRQIADRLYLSVKTVEGHLTTIYGKLGLASRAQLIATGIGRPAGNATID